MQELARRFVPAADEVGRLQRGQDAEAVFFHSFCEKGHYGGRTEPSATRQGIYAVAPSGAFLASCNTRSPRVMEKMLRRALERFDALPAAECGLGARRRSALAAVHRWRDTYLEDGLVLEVVSRDLQPRGAGPDWRRQAWNLDYAWFKKDEARSFLGDDLSVGAEHAVPRALVERIARFHLVDNVRGQTPGFDADAVEKATLRTEVTAVDGDSVSLRLRGASRVVRHGRWPVAGFHDRNDPRQQELGFEVQLSGEARYDRRQQRFLAFELVADGKRWGGTQFNARGDDLAPSAIGVVLHLSDGRSRVAPAAIWRYGWKR